MTVVETAAHLPGDYDGEIESLLAEPPDAVAERERSEFERLVASCGDRVVLYGCGSIGTRAVTALRSIGVEPLAFADGDRSKWGTAVAGVPVVSPNWAAQSFGSSALFVVTIWNAKQRFAATKSTLRAMGCTNIASPGALQWRFAESFLPYFSLDLPRHVIRERKEVLGASSLWADERSRREFLTHIKWRLRGEFEALLSPTPELQYFPSFVRLAPREIFVDCGAYDGDTLREFLARGDDLLEKAMAIEPSPETYARLEHWATRLPTPLRSKIEMRACAVGSSRGTIRFSGAGRDAHVSGDGEYSVALDTLDDLCGDQRPTYIKMDIEGAEADALAGARSAIVRNRPILAVCAYHTQNDLWRIPLLIREMVPDYEMFLRSHENDGWETVVYGIPPERSSVVR